MEGLAIAGDRVEAHFRTFDTDAYKLFLRMKALPETRVRAHKDLTYTLCAPVRYASLLGLELPSSLRDGLPVKVPLFDDQRAVLTEALLAKRFACFCDCGWGKTLVGLEWARQVHHRTQGRILIVTQNEIQDQWLSESQRFYGSQWPVEKIPSRQAMRDWMAGGDGSNSSLAVVNYEKWNPEDLDRQVVDEAKSLAGIILDESSRLKGGGGKQKWALIKSCRGIEYKLSLTATPAPNEIMEFASQASFLERMRDQNEIIWTYFRRDEKMHRWTVKPHALASFYKFLAGWSIYIRDPRRYGWRLGMAEVPLPEVLEHQLRITEQQREAWLRESVDQTGQRLLYHQRDTNAIQRMKLSQIAKGFRYRAGEKGEYDRIFSLKPSFVASLAADEVKAGRQVIIWTNFDAEGEIIAEFLGDAHNLDHQQLTGKTPKASRGKILQRFTVGEFPVLVSRASVLGFGMNLQFVGAHVFSGFSDSYEQHYQAVRRSYRFGQKERLRVHIPYVPELEGEMWQNLKRKETQMAEAIARMEEHYISARQEVQP